jgi:hypothetical protein
MTPTPPKFTTGRGHEKLNRALESRILDVIGGPFVVCNRTGDTVTVSVSLEQLLPRIPKPSGAGGGVIVKIAANASGGGQYTGYIITGDSTADGTGNLAMPEGMTVPDDVDALVCNINETSTHDLAVGQFVIGVDRGTDADGRTIVFTDSYRTIC